MLAISAGVRGASWKYCYLDGATKQRMLEVTTFNKDRSIRPFSSA